MGKRIVGRRRAVLAAAFVIAAAACAALVGGGSAARAGLVSVQPACGAVPVGFERCFALRVVGNALPAGSIQVSGYGPADLQSAYKLPSGTAGAGQTVAIVDAFDDPTAESDLGVYRSNFGLPACTTANGCFRKVDQNGGTHYPVPDHGWSEEISLDLDMVSAICPKCHILLVEANDNSGTNLFKAVDEAAALGANTISNSYGGGEYSGETTDDSHFNHPGVAITASSGDSGFGSQYPAASRFVTSVGGTALTKAPATKRGWKETAWSGAGSGCSAFESKPTWQTDPGCSRRTIADVSADADPATGVAVFYTGDGGWLVFGGTSVSSPIIASVYALAGNASTVNYGSFPYLHKKGHIYDIKKGSNGSCGGSYLCTAMKGYDGPTGLGTPKTAGGF
jgi:subtilase family serine protease